MTDAQRKAAQALINGPRRTVFGPFVPLLQSPVSDRQRSVASVITCASIARSSLAYASS